MSREGALLLLVPGRQLVSLTPCRCRKALLIGTIVMHWFETQLTTSEMPKEGALHHLSALLHRSSILGCCVSPYLLQEAKYAVRPPKETSCS